LLVALYLAVGADLRINRQSSYQEFLRKKPNARDSL
jgi:hypothetical protein